MGIGTGVEGEELGQTLALSGFQLTGARGEAPDRNELRSLEGAIAMTMLGRTNSRRCDSARPPPFSATEIGI